MLNFAKFSSGLTVIAATGFLIGAMLTDNGGQPPTKEISLILSPVNAMEGMEITPKVNAIDHIITNRVERVRRLENNDMSVDDLLIMARIDNAVHEKAKKVQKITSLSDSGSSVTVQTGDTLYGIGLKYGLTTAEIASMNDLSDPFTVRVGQKLRVN